MNKLHIIHFADISRSRAISSGNTFIIISIVIITYSISHKTRNGSAAGIGFNHFGLGMIILKQGMRNRIYFALIVNAGSSSMIVRFLFRRNDNIGNIILPRSIKIIADYCQIGNITDYTALIIFQNAMISAGSGSICYTFGPMCFHINILYGQIINFIDFTTIYVFNRTSMRCVIICFPRNIFYNHILN